MERDNVDIAFPRQRVAVFIDGCFWHGCPTHATLPATNADWWREKLEANMRRDMRTVAMLEEAGWTVLRFWEHVAPADVVQSLAQRLTGARPHDPC